MFKYLSIANHAQNQPYGPYDTGTVPELSNAASRTDQFTKLAFKFRAFEIVLINLVVIWHLLKPLPRFLYGRTLLFAQRNSGRFSSTEFQS